MVNPEAILEEMFRSYSIKGEFSLFKFHIRVLDLNRQWHVSSDRLH